MAGGVRPIHLFPHLTIHLFPSLAVARGVRLSRCLQLIGSHLSPIATYLSPNLAIWLMVSGSPHVSNSCVPTYQLYYSNLFVSQSGWRSPAFPMFSIHLFPHLAINSFVSQSRRLWFPPCLPPCLVSTVSPTLSPILRLPCFVFHLVPISRSRGRYPDSHPVPMHVQGSGRVLEPWNLVS